MPFTSPNYPLPYDNNADCLWTIETKPSYTSDYIVKVTFVEFELEGHSAGSCRYDILKFYSGLPLESHLLGSYCSRARPDVIYSTGRKLYVNFQTDSTSVYKGFKFYYTAVKKGTCVVQSPCKHSNAYVVEASWINESPPPLVRILI